MSFQIMLVSSDARLMSGIRSSHSTPSDSSCPPCPLSACPAWSPSAGDVSPCDDGALEGTSFIPHLWHVPGAEAVTSGCIGQAYEDAAGLPGWATSFMPHFGHLPGSPAVTSGCMGQAYAPALASCAP